MSRALLNATRSLAEEVDRLHFGEPTAYVYNPLVYAREAHEQYLRQFGSGRKRVVFLGMNPGPWGMAQVGVPFGEIGLVRDWLGIDCAVGRPDPEHPKRPITGFDCQRSEVSGRRFWGLMRDRFGSAEAFFADHFVLNYCPLVFMEASGRNRTPDKLPAEERQPLYAACDRFLVRALDVLGAEILIAVGGFAEHCLRRNAPDARILRILHPSPASPAANRDWAGVVEVGLEEEGVW